MRRHVLPLQLCRCCLRIKVDSPACLRANRLHCHALCSVEPHVIAPHRTRQQSALSAALQRLSRWHLQDHLGLARLLHGSRLLRGSGLLHGSALLHNQVAMSVSLRLCRHDAGTTPLGKALRAKVLKPLLRAKLKSRSLDKPLLVRSRGPGCAVSLAVSTRPPPHALPEHPAGYAAQWSQDIDPVCWPICPSVHMTAPITCRTPQLLLRR